jgi:hypothetical protein
MFFRLQLLMAISLIRKCSSISGFNLWLRRNHGLVPAPREADATMVAGMLNLSLRGYWL